MTYEDVKEVCEISNRNFQQVTTQETVFEETERRGHIKKLDNLKVDKAELLGLINGLDGKKAMGPDNV